MYEFHSGVPSEFKEFEDMSDEEMQYIRGYRKGKADGRAEAIYEAIKIADCSHTDCWDCAFGEADICKLQQLYGQLKEQK